MTVLIISFMNRLDSDRAEDDVINPPIYGVNRVCFSDLNIKMPKTLALI